MARDRQRAKQRKQRREPTPPSREGGRDDAAAPNQGEGIVPDPRPLHRENVPGSVEHTGDVDQFEAALVAGADGEPETGPDAVERAALGAETDPEFDGPLEDEADVDREPVGAVAAPSRATTPEQNASGRGGGRFLNFLRACWAELQRVQWPDRRQVGQATMVVLGFVVIAGAFLGFADFVAEQVVELII